MFENPKIRRTRSKGMSGGLETRAKLLQFLFLAMSGCVHNVFDNKTAAFLGDRDRWNEFAIAVDVACGRLQAEGKGDILIFEDLAKPPMTISVPAMQVEKLFDLAIDADVFGAELWGNGGVPDQYPSTITIATTGRYLSNSFMRSDAEEDRAWRALIKEADGYCSLIYQLKRK